VPTLHLRNGKDCIVVLRDNSRVVYVGRIQDCKAHEHKNHLRTEREVTRAENWGILVFALLLMAVVIIWGWTSG
jgi:hypothetical protein